MSNKLRQHLAFILVNYLTSPEEKADMILDAVIQALPEKLQREDTLQPASQVQGYLKGHNMALLKMKQILTDAKGEK